MVSTTKKSVKVKKYSIKETTFVKFNYPYVMLIKGCTEVIMYTVDKDRYYYVRLDCPII